MNNDAAVMTGDILPYCNIIQLHVRNRGEKIPRTLSRREKTVSSEHIKCKKCLKYQVLFAFNLSPAGWILYVAAAHLMFLTVCLH